MKVMASLLILAILATSTPAPAQAIPLRSRDLGFEAQALTLSLAANHTGAARLAMTSALFLFLSYTPALVAAQSSPPGNAGQTAPAQISAQKFEETMTMEAAREVDLAALKKTMLTLPRAVSVEVTHFLHQYENDRRHLSNEQGFIEYLAEEMDERLYAKGFNATWQVRKGKLYFAFFRQDGPIQTFPNHGDGIPFFVRPLRFIAGDAKTATQHMGVSHLSRNRAYIFEDVIDSEAKKSWKMRQLAAPIVQTVPSPAGSGELWQRVLVTGKTFSCLQSRFGSAAPVLQDIFSESQKGKTEGEHRRAMRKSVIDHELLHLWFNTLNTIKTGRFYPGHYHKTEFAAYLGSVILAEEPEWELADLLGMLSHKTHPFFSKASNAIFKGMADALREKLPAYAEKLKGYSSRTEDLSADDAAEILQFVRATVSDPQARKHMIRFAALKLFEDEIGNFYPTLRPIAQFLEGSDTFISLPELRRSVGPFMVDRKKDGMISGAIKTASLLTASNTRELAEVKASERAQKLWEVFSERANGKGWHEPKDIDAPMSKQEREYRYLLNPESLSLTPSQGHDLWVQEYLAPIVEAKEFVTHASAAAFLALHAGGDAAILMAGAVGVVQAGQRAYRAARAQYSEASSRRRSFVKNAQAHREFNAGQRFANNVLTISGPDAFLHFKSWLNASDPAYTNAVAEMTPSSIYFQIPSTWFLLLAALPKDTESASRLFRWLAKTSPLIERPAPDDESIVVEFENHNAVSSRLGLTEGAAKALIKKVGHYVERHPDQFEFKTMLPEERDEFLTLMKDPSNVERFTVTRKSEQIPTIKSISFRDEQFTLNQFRTSWPRVFSEHYELLLDVYKQPEAMYRAIRNDEWTTLIEDGYFAVATGINFEPHVGLQVIHYAKDPQYAGVIIRIREPYPVFNISIGGAVRWRPEVPHILYPEDLDYSLDSGSTWVSFEEAVLRKLGAATKASGDGDLNIAGIGPEPDEASSDKPNEPKRSQAHLVDPFEENAQQHLLGIPLEQSARQSRITVKSSAFADGTTLRDVGSALVTLLTAAFMTDQMTAAFTVAAILALPVGIWIWRAKMARSSPRKKHNVSELSLVLAA